MDVNDDCYPCSGRSIYEAMRPSASPLITEMPGGDVARHAVQKTAYRTTLPQHLHEAWLLSLISRKDYRASELVCDGD